MRKRTFIIVLIFLSSQMSAQSNWEKFRKLPAPYKKWVLLHPFKVKKALEISFEVTRVSDSVAKTDLLDKDKAGGQVDAFRHAYWTARLQQEIGKRGAISLGKTHEKGNYKTFKQHQTENGIVPDNASKEMDLFNNNIGLRFTQKGIPEPQKEIILRIVNAILMGDLKVIKKDTVGNFLTCDGELIPSEELLHSWQNKKCLIPSSK
ncbi:MAG: hypothetical protein A3F91_14270 [Flavobacteria bacterium RIFCSPLOWO2_12_FULL_35_11]|nr:MAG: hypothetical protein A3F91_14270 [Flavobacteria bacterium RIFCSPLOWO2_12_FULL_35_11]